MGALAVYASVTYRRLRARLDAARHAEVEAAERARLFQSELKAREDFLSVASHELKTPMTSLLLQVESLARRGGAAPSEIPDRLAAKHGVISRQTRRLATLVDTLLDASRIQIGRLEIVPESVDLVDVVETCLLSFEEDAHRVQSTIELYLGKSPIALRPPEMRTITAARIPGRWDPRRLEQILGNLVANAVRYGAGQPIEVRLAAGEQQVTIAVRDHGIGIAPADHRRIFERFEQVSTDKSTGGLGLGLWITQQLVEVMGGRVLLTSALGEGSTFTIELPRYTTAASLSVGRGPTRIPPRASSG
jgi:signal transduction histidine kinase